MAVAAEALSPEASEAVSAAAAGRGRRLSPEVSQELTRRASRKAKAAAKAAPASTSSGARAGGGPGVARLAGGAVKTTTKAAESTLKGATGAPTPVIRIILAFGAFLLALEVASYLSGRYFTWNIGQGAQRIQGASQHIDLYPGQTAKLQAQKVTTLPLGKMG